MGKNVNVVLWDGTVASVSEEDAALLQGTTARPETDQEQQQREVGGAASQLNQERTGGLIEGAKAIGEGAADTLTGGIYGKVTGAIDENYGENLALRGQYHPYARAAGELGAMLLPTGAFGAEAKAVSEVSALGLAGKVGEIAAGFGGKALGRFAEGAVIGGGGYIARSNVTGDPLQIEGFLEDAGVGGLINYGFGVAADKFAGITKNAQVKQADYLQLKADVDLVKSNTSVFDDNPAYNEFAAAHKAGQKEALKTYKEAKKAWEATSDTYNKVATGEGVSNILSEFDAAQTELRTRLAANANNQASAAGLEHTPFDVAPSNEPTTTIDPTTGNQTVSFSPLQDEASQLQNGAQTISKSITAAKTALKAGDYDGALAVLKGGADDFGKLGMNDITLPDVPTQPAPFTMKTPWQVDLPKDVTSFAKATPAKIANIANNASPEAARAFDRLADSLGMSKNDTVAGTIAGVHNDLQPYIKAWDRLQARAAEKARPTKVSTILDAPLKVVRNGVKYAASRMADRAVGGGGAGAFIRTLAGGMMGYSIDTAEDVLLGGSLLGAKQSIGNKINTVIATYGNKATNVLGELGPVTAFLHATFPNGSHDHDTDVAVLAAKRSAEVQQAAAAGPDAMFSMVESLMGAPDDLAYKLHQALVKPMQYLAQMAPKDPGNNFTPFSSKWLPSLQESSDFARRIEAVLFPLRAIVRTLAGDGHQATTEALWNNWPATMQEVANSVCTNASEFSKMDYVQANGLSALLGAPMSSLDDPTMGLSMQGMYLQNSQMMNSTVKPQTPSGGGGLGGRPPAINNQVAGSSVTNLTQ